MSFSIALIHVHQLKHQCLLYSDRWLLDEKQRILGTRAKVAVSVLAFYSNDPSLNPAVYLNFLYEET